jgi:hypothetical protein
LICGHPEGVQDGPLEKVVAPLQGANRVQTD